MHHAEVTIECTMEEAPRRIAGCQSTNHDDCYGDLWTCSNCGKTVCCAEGSDNDPALCDDCWAQHHVRPTLAVPKSKPPNLDTLLTWILEEGGCEATDGCWVEPDGTCPHGAQSWFLELGLI